MQVSEAMKKEIAFVNFRAKSIKEVWTSDQKKIQIEWYASTKDKDRYGDVVESGAFVKTMELYMENPMLLLQHDPARQIWVVTWYSIDATGLYINADVKYKAWDDELFDKITNWDLKGFSIWFRIKELELLEEIQDGNTVWTWVIKELELLEISVVTIPANPYTLMKSIDWLFEKSFKSVEDIWEQEPVWENPEDVNIETPTEQTQEPTTEVVETPEVNEEWGGETPEEITGQDPVEPIEAPTEEPEKQDETPASEPAGWTEKQEWGFTLKMIDKIVEAKTEAIRKQFGAREKQIKDDIQKSFDERFKAFEEDTVKSFEWLMEIIQNQSNSIKTLSEWMEKMTSGKWFIYQEQAPKEDWRDKSVLAKLEIAKQF